MSIHGCLEHDMLCGQHVRPEKYELHCHVVTMITVTSKMRACGQAFPTALALAHCKMAVLVQAAAEMQLFI